MNIRLQKLSPDAVTPTYGTPFSAGADLYACEAAAVSIAPGETKMIHTGIAVEIPEGYAGFNCARSGMACKRGLAPANKVGVIDSDYRGEILVALHNHGACEQTVEPGERIAQLLIVPVAHAVFNEVASLSDTQRGEGGFGSTGSK